MCFTLQVLLLNDIYSFSQIHYLCSIRAMCMHVLAFICMYVQGCVCVHMHVHAHARQWQEKVNMYIMFTVHYLESSVSALSFFFCTLVSTSNSAEEGCIIHYCFCKWIFSLLYYIFVTSKQFICQNILDFITSDWRFYHFGHFICAENVMQIFNVKLLNHIGYIIVFLHWCK